MPGSLSRIVVAQGPRHQSSASGTARRSDRRRGSAITVSPSQFGRRTSDPPDRVAGDEAGLHRPLPRSRAAASTRARSSARQASGLPSGARRTLSAHTAGGAGPPGAGSDSRGPGHRGRQAHAVLLRGHQKVRADRPGPPRIATRSRGSYAWWSGNATRSRTVAPWAASVSASRSGAAIPAKARTARPRRAASGMPRARREVLDPLDRVVRREARRRSRVAVDLPEERTQVPPAGRARRDDEVRAREGRGRFPEGAAREEAARAPRRAGVQAHDLHVLQEAPLLEAVVEQHDVRAEMRDRPLPRRETIRADHDAHARQSPGQEQGLVARRARPEASALRRPTRARPAPSLGGRSRGSRPPPGGRPRRASGRPARPQGSCPCRRPSGSPRRPPGTGDARAPGVPARRQSPGRRGPPGTPTTPGSGRGRAAPPGPRARRGPAGPVGWRRAPSSPGSHAGRGPLRRHRALFAGSASTRSSAPRVRTQAPW